MVACFSTHTLGSALVTRASPLAWTTEQELTSTYLATYSAGEDGELVRSERVVACAMSPALGRHECRFNGRRNKMIRGTLWALVLSIAWSLPGQPARAGQVPAARVVVEAHGLELSVTSLRRSFPRNALALGVARLRNVPQHAVLLVDLCTPHGGSALFTLMAKLVHIEERTSRYS